jgi:hypothetical protein
MVVQAREQRWPVGITKLAKFVLRWALPIVNRGNAKKKILKQNWRNLLTTRFVYGLKLLRLLYIGCNSLVGKGPLPMFRNGEGGTQLLSQAAETKTSRTLPRLGSDETLQYIGL